MLAKSVLLIVLLGLVHFTSTAPVKDADAEKETPVDLVNNDVDQQTDTDSKDDVSPTPEVLTKPEETDNVNKEVTNYQTIETDDHGKVEPVIADTEGDEDTGLTEEEAQELLLELSDPEEVAQFIVASDDAQGFLQALRLLTDQNYISLKLAYYLRDRVMEQLRRMLMIQEMELSRTLLNNYEPADFTPDQLPNDVPPAPYYDFNTFPATNDMYSEDVSPYEIYEQTLREENSRALAEIAEAVAQKIAKGDLTPESGVKIMNTVASLLPDSYWEDALNLFEEGEDNVYPLAYDEPTSDYSSASESLEGDVIDLTENSDETSTEDEDDTGDNLEAELKNKNRVLENALEKQLAEKAHSKETITPSEGEDEVHLQQDNSSDEFDLTDEDYQELLDWLQNELQDSTKQQEQKPGALLVKDDDDDGKVQGEQPEENSS